MRLILSFKSNVPLADCEDARRQCAGWAMKTEDLPRTRFEAFPAPPIWPKKGPRADRHAGGRTAMTMPTPHIPRYGPRRQGRIVARFAIPSRCRLVITLPSKAAP